MNRLLRNHFRMDGKAKKVYPSRESAWTSANAQGGTAYRCTFCGLWHIATKSRRPYK